MKYLAKKKKIVHGLKTTEKCEAYYSMGMHGTVVGKLFLGSLITFLDSITIFFLRNFVSFLAMKYSRCDCTWVCSLLLYSPLLSVKYSIRSIYNLPLIIKVLDGLVLNIIHRDKHTSTNHMTHLLVWPKLNCT